MQSCRNQTNKGSVISNTWFPRSPWPLTHCQQRGKKWRQITYKVFMGQAWKWCDDFIWHSIGQNLVTWSHVTTRVGGKCSPCLGSHFPETIRYEKGAWIICGRQPKSAKMKIIVVVAAEATIYCVPVPAKCLTNSFSWSPQNSPVKYTLLSHF